ncbi:MAG: hypothetical protein KDI71_06120 [Xanthomonadales bacterium]|nr:hypothetical protein [Xanthomonadales bacterium]
MKARINMPSWILIALLLAGCAAGDHPPERAGVIALGPITHSLERPSSTDLRVLNWNVSRQSFFDQTEDFRRVLAMVNADLLILDEMPVDRDANALRRALQGLGDPQRSWQVIYGNSGGRERSTIAAQDPLERVTRFDQNPYPDALGKQWLAAANDARSQARLQQGLQSGVTMVGARLTWQGREVLIAGLDFQCCGDGGDSWEESRRRFEAGALRSAIDASRTAQTDGILVGGDFNAVNGPAPLMIVQGESARRDQLKAVQALHLDGIERWTWDGRGTPYASGQLDHQMHGRALRPVNAFVLDLDDLSAPQRQAHGLDGLDLTRLTPHRPVIVDYIWVD